MTTTQIVDTLDAHDLEQEIMASLKLTAVNAVQIGYLLKQLKEKGQYDDWAGYVQEKFSISGSTASRFMGLNTKYGRGMELAGRYKDMSVGVLIEMLNMSPELEEQVTPDMTVKEVRKLKKQDRQSKQEEEEIVSNVDTEIIEGAEYREIIAPEPENFATSQKDETWFVKEYIKRRSTKEDLIMFMQICRDNMSNGGRAMAVQKYISPYGYSGGGDWEFSAAFHGLAGGIDFKSDSRKVEMHMKYGRFVEELLKLYDPYAPEFMGNKPEVKAADFATSQKTTRDEGADCPPNVSQCIRQEWGTDPEQQEAGKKECKKCWTDWKKQQKALEQMQEQNKDTVLSAIGLPMREYPADSGISIEGCGTADCFRCGRECDIRQEDRYCVEAPLGNPFGCTTMHVLDNLKTEVGEQCQFIDLDKAYHRLGDKEPVPCCKDCTELCGYRCQRSVAKSTPEDTEEVVTEIPEPEEYTARYFLEEQKAKLNDMLKATSQPEKVLTRQKIIVGALAAMVSELEEDIPCQIEQPNFPVLKNMDQREDFVNTFRDWPVWCRNELTEEVFYRYNLSDGAAIIVKEYPFWAWGIEQKGKVLYLLKPDTKHFKDAETSMTVIKEHLKDMGKDDKSNG